MLKNRQQNEIPLAACENGSSSISEMGNSNSATNSTISPETGTNDSAASNGSAIANGINNNHHEHVEGNGEELSSTVEIEVTENPVNGGGDFVFEGEHLTSEDMETTVDDGAGSSSQDDGMISSAATSTSSSVISVDRQIQLDQPRQASNPPAAPADQPEVTDFLDMDFDVEPTSTDEDEDNVQSAFIRKEKLFRREQELSPMERNLPCQRWDGNGMDDGGFDYDNYECEAGPSTSFSNGQSTIPKENQFSAVSESYLCVHGCPACNNDSSSGRDERNPRPSTANEYIPILGDLPSNSNASPVPSSRIPRWAEQHQHQWYGCRWTNRYRWSDRPSNRLNQSQSGINVGGPDGLRLARSAYVGFPGGQRVAGTGYSSTSRANMESGISFRIWSIDEAESIQATQIGPSMCGATALLNVLKALGFDIGTDKSGASSSLGTISVQEVERAVPTRIRENSAPLAEYLLSRSVAGTDAEDLIDAASNLTNSRVLGRFFPMTERTIMTEWQEEQFGRWLLDWLQRGAVPVLTLNMQRGLLPVEPVPDAWHHQMVFGVCTRTGGVFLTNPLECVPLWFLKHALCSSSVLLVKTDDVRQRWNGGLADMAPLLSSTSPEESMEPRPVDAIRWTEMNVLGQIARTLRQTSQPPNTRSNEPPLTHISIPARYRSGVTLYALADSEIWMEISNAPSIDVSLTPPRHVRTLSDLPDPVSEWGEEASSVLITIGDEMDNGNGEGDETSAGEEVRNAEETGCSHENCEHSQSCDMM